MSNPFRESFAQALGFTSRRFVEILTLDAEPSPIEYERLVWALDQLTRDQRWASEEARRKVLGPRPDFTVLSALRVLAYDVKEQRSAELLDRLENIVQSTGERND
jgi:hypothetical protein